MIFKKIITLYSNNHVKLTKKLCAQDRELLVVKVGCSYSYH
jgi:hypothetical protein